MVTAQVWALPASISATPEVSVCTATGLGSDEASVISSFTGVYGSRTDGTLSLISSYTAASGAQPFAAGAGTSLVPMFSSRSELNKELLANAQHRDADIVFDQDYSLDLGGVIAKIRAMGANHTLGDTIVLVDGVLFTGDIVMKPLPMVINPTSTLTHWLASLDALEALHPKRIVPSHGPFGGVELIEAYRSYLTRIRARTAELKKAGKTLDETIQVISGEMLEQYPDQFRLTSAIRAGYDEAS